VDIRAALGDRTALEISGAENWHRAIGENSTAVPGR
jgi:hypothetical protein